MQGQQRPRGSESESPGAGAGFPFGRMEPAAGDPPGLPGGGAFGIIQLGDPSLAPACPLMLEHMSAPAQLISAQAMQQQQAAAQAHLQAQHDTIISGEQLLSGENAFMSGGLGNFANVSAGGNVISTGGGMGSSAFMLQQQGGAAGFQTLGAGGGLGGAGASASDRMTLARLQAAANANAAAAMAGVGGPSADPTQLMQQSAMGGLGMAANRGLEFAGFGNMHAPHQMSSSLYIKNLPPDADKLFLYERFSPYGAILSVKVLSDPTSGACRGVGFVNYSDHHSAVRAIQALHGTKLGDKLLHVSLQTPRMRPPP